MKKTYRQCFSWGMEYLTKAGIVDARVDARLLLEFVCGTSQHDLLLHGDKEVDTAQYEQYEICIRKRGERVPLQYITGTQVFMGFEFQVNEHVLIPRQDTEILVEEALKILSTGLNVPVAGGTGQPKRILDMCTGSGCILLSLLALAGDEMKTVDTMRSATFATDKTTEISGVGVDISPEALKVAEGNLEIISNRCGRKLQAEFLESDLFSVFSKEAREFDMIVSNPPYIASEVIHSLEPEVRLHEPVRALDGTADGLYFYRKIVTESIPFLKRGGCLLFEIGYDQGEAVSGLMKAAGFVQVTVKQDYAGLDRIVYGFLEEI